jgi:formylglycine-generating enzyme required for sulfatase activity
MGYPCWTADTGFVLWGQLAAHVLDSAGVPSTPVLPSACALLTPGGLGAAYWDPVLPDPSSGVSFGPCGGSGLQNGQNGAFQGGQPISINVSVTDPTQVVVFAAVLDNIEQASPTNIPLSSAPNTLNAITSASQGLGTAAGVFSTVTGVGLDWTPVGAFIGGAAAIVSLEAPTSGGTSMPGQAISCTGGVFATGDGKAGDTLFFQLTGRQLDDLAKAGFGQITLRHSGSWAPTTTDVVGTVDHCAADLTLTFTVMRVWSGGLAVAPRSADFAIVSAPQQTDVFVVPQTVPPITCNGAAVCSGADTANQFVSVVGQMGSFGPVQGTDSYFNNPAPINEFVNSGTHGALVQLPYSANDNDLFFFWANTNGELRSQQLSHSVKDFNYFDFRNSVVAFSATFPPPPAPGVSLVPANANIAAVARSQIEVDAFFLDLAGRLWDVWTHDAGKTWNNTPASSLTDLGTPGGPVAAVARTPFLIDVYYMSSNGLVYASYDMGRTPQWSAVTVPNTAGLAPAGAYVTAVAPTVTEADAFFVGSDGRLWKAWLSIPDKQTIPFVSQVSSTDGEGLAGGRIASVSRRPDYFDVAFVASDGRTPVWYSKIKDNAWSPKGTIIPIADVSNGISLVAPSSAEVRAFGIDSHSDVHTADWVSVGYPVWTGPVRVLSASVAELPLPAVAPSCAGDGAGTAACGTSGDSCCTSLDVPAGTFDRNYGPLPDGGVTGENQAATLSEFRLDKYEVTVGRFRQFAAAWNGGQGFIPSPGSGIHADLNGGNGLTAAGAPSGTAPFESGWVAGDEQNIAPTTANLQSCTPSTWTDTPSSQENLPINCVNWFEAQAFCIWDGGFLPSEAEREYAAAGGGQQREFAWGWGTDSPSNQYAIYNCNYPGPNSDCTNVEAVAPVGSALLGGGLWGQMDLSGGLFDWNLDWYTPGAFIDPCTDCFDARTTQMRTIKGGAFNTTSSTSMVPSARAGFYPALRTNYIGFRCARPPNQPQGAICSANSDCASNVCSSGTCQPPPPPTCSPNCANGAACTAGSDCASNICTSGACQPPPPPACSPSCPLGAICGTSTDCASNVCANGVCQQPSCAGSGPGVSACGASSNSCCTSPEVPAGTYDRNYSPLPQGGVSAENQPATLSGFRLDTYEVTVGRFRPFVAAWNGGQGFLPAAGSGMHAHLNGGQGLAAFGAPSGNAFETGWGPSDDGNIAPTTTNLLSCTPSTWTATPGAQEDLPINCVNWYEAQAFCIWDGGFLPSEAEREYAAAGGNQQREFAWGWGTASPSNQYGVYSCNYPTNNTVLPNSSCANPASVAPVGGASLGAGLWGQMDLSGNLFDWNVDWYTAGAFVEPCTDCFDARSTQMRVIKGGAWSSTSVSMVPSARAGFYPAVRTGYVGFRCARVP